MNKHITSSFTHRPDRRRRCARPLVEGLEVREVPSSFQLPSSLVLLNPQPLPPGSSSPAVFYPPNPCRSVSPCPIVVHNLNPGPI